MASEFKRSIKKELYILRMLKGHKHVLHLYEIFETESQIILITEILEGGDLYSYIKNNKQLSEEATHRIFL